MLQDLQAWFLQDPTTVSSLVFAGISVVSLVVFYALLRKKDAAPQEDAYETFLAEEFKLAAAAKEPEIVELPPDVNVIISDKIEDKKPVAKKAAKKKTTAKKTAKKKTAKAQVEKK